MKQKLNSEFLFEKPYVNNKDEARIVRLTLYVNYETKTYDFMQECQEGIMPRCNNYNIETNRAYLELGLEILEFVAKELKFKH